MPAPLFYRPNPRWQLWAGFCGAVLIHVTAVALAERSAPAPVLIVEPPAIDIIPLLEDPAPPQPIEPPPEIALPPPPTSDSSFVEDNPTPAPIPPRNARTVPPLVRTVPAAPSLTATSAKVLAISAPRPEYPYEARRQRATGSGVAVLTIDAATGLVTDVRMARSTGNPVLDNATISGFLRWRFRPGTVSTVQTPITYTLTGAAF